MIADGLVSWQGAQLAIDATLVAPLHLDGSATKGTTSRPRMALEQTNWKKEATFPELAGDAGHARLVVQSLSPLGTPSELWDKKRHSF